jgi:hypothetical protein
MDHVMHGLAPGMYPMRITYHLLNQFWTPIDSSSNTFGIYY